jgi:hypothetical protein
MAQERQRGVAFGKMTRPIPQIDQRVGVRARLC